MDLLTVQETAQMLKFSPVTTRRFIAAGRLPVIKVGRAVRVRRDSVEQLLDPVVPRHLRDDDDERDLRDGPPTTEDDPIWSIVGIFDPRTSPWPIGVKNATRCRAPSSPARRPNSGRWQRPTSSWPRRTG